MRCSFYCEKRYFCSKYRFDQSTMEENHKSVINEKMKVLIAGLRLWDIEANIINKRDDGSATTYPCIGFGFTPNPEVMRRLKIILYAYHNTKKNCEEEWIIEKEVGKCCRLVPKDKHLTIEKLEENIDKLGWFLHQTR